MKPNTTSSDLDEHKYFIGFFLIIIFILFLRSPEIILKGRFWGEEGLVYFKYAYEHNPFATLFFIDFRCGYYYFSATVSALLASLVPLEFAPFVSTLFCYCSNYICYLFHAISFIKKYIFENCLLPVFGNWIASSCGSILQFYKYTSVLGNIRSISLVFRLRDIEPREIKKICSNPKTA